jgi:hypothetical protein
MPAEPIQIQGATIVVSNADLIPYLTRIVPGSGITVAELDIRDHEASLRRSVAPVRERPSPALQVISDAKPVNVLPAKAQIPAPVPLVAAVQVIPAPAVIAPVVKPASNPTQGSTESRVQCDPSLSLGEIAACYRVRKAAQPNP